MRILSTYALHTAWKYENKYSETKFWWNTYILSKMVSTTEGSQQSKLITFFFISFVSTESTPLLRFCLYESSMNNMPLKHRSCLNISVPLGMLLKALVSYKARRNMKNRFNYLVLNDMCFMFFIYMKTFH